MVFPNVENLGPFPLAVSYALKSELGSTHQAVKIIMRWTGAGERTVKNWLAGISGPSGQHLVDLIRHSDGVLEVILILAGRQCHRLWPCVMNEGRLLIYKDLLSRRSSFLSASEGNALSS